MTPSRLPDSARRRGSVIVVVLAMVTLAAFFLARFIERSLTELMVEARARQSERLRAGAQSALEATLAALADYQAADNGLRSPAQGWGEPLAGPDYSPPAGTTVAVAIEDESGKVSLPRMNAPALQALGRQLGLKDGDADRLADALLGWTKREHASVRHETDPRNYEFEDPPHRPPGRPLESLGELAAIAVARELFFTPAGRPNELHGRFARTVSLIDFPAVNLNAARSETLALAGLDEDQIERITAFNSGATRRPPGTPPYFRSIAEAQALLGATVPLAGFDTVVRCLRIRVTVREGAIAYHLTAVVQPVAPAADGTAGPAAPGLQYPFTLLAFEEDVELPNLPPS